MTTSTNQSTMSEHDINSTGHDENGRYYDLAEDAPFEGITVDEATNTITVHGQPAVEDALQNLLAIERDRLLGYPTGELHMRPERAVREAWDALSARGYNRDELILPDDQDRLDL